MNKKVGSLNIRGGDVYVKMEVLNLNDDYNHRVSIEWKSPYKESYTVNSH